MHQNHPAPPGDHFAVNLASLLAAQPQLCERLHWPVEGDHLFRVAVGDEDGHWNYRFRGTCHRFDLEAGAVEESLRGLPSLEAKESGQEILVFGLGLGEQLRALLACQPRARILAWDRDPWVLRQVLRREDWSEALTAGRLRFALGADLIEHVASGWSAAVLWHPLLAGVYANERLLVQGGLRDKRALVCTGTLFVDSLADALREEGYCVYTFDAERLAVEELELVVEEFCPDVVCGINYVNGLAEFCAGRGFSYLCWEIDPATDEPQPMEADVCHAHVFTYRAANVECFRRAGFANVEYLPLAADPSRRQPLELSPGERTTYGSSVSFVGASLMENVVEFQASFLRQVELWRPESGDLGRAALFEVVRGQRADFSTYLVPELLEAQLGGFRAHCLGQGQPDPALLIAEVCAAEKRLNYVAELAGHGMAVWGDQGWAQLEQHGVDYRGPARHEYDLPRIYNATRVNIDIGRLYQGDIVTMRIFDILACGGFVLAEHSQALAELFEIDLEIASFRTLEELDEKLRYFLAHPDAARGIAERGRRAVLERHRISTRVRRMLAGLEEQGELPGRAAVA